MDRGRYSIIFRRMWNDEKFRRLSKPQPCGQSLWMRFLCGPELGPIPGLFAAREPGLADAMGWSTEPFRKSFRELLANGLAKADWEAGLVWVPNAILYNEPANPNVVKSWADAWVELPECPLKSEAHARLCEYMKTRGEPFESTFVNRCPNRSQNGCPNQDQDQEREQEDPPIAPPGGRARRRGAEPSEAFKQFWAAYPRKVSKGQAIRSWPGDDLLGPILAALEWQAPFMRRELARNPSDPKVKHPGTWLNARCWEDERPASHPSLLQRPTVKTTLPEWRPRGDFAAEAAADAGNPSNATTHNDERAVEALEKLKQNLTSHVTP